MNTTDNALKERIKELTCLYEVSSIIVNADFEQIQDTIKAIVHSLKRAFQFPAHTNVSIETEIANYTSGAINETLSIVANIKMFNKVTGKITASLFDDKSSFLYEEHQLLDSIALKLGNLMERLHIQRNEASLKRQMEHADRLSILGELTAGIAHELNTPLANILGYAELLKENIPKTSTNSDDVEKIIQNAIFSREVVKKLMFFACEMPQEMKTINIVSSIKNAINLLDATFRKAQVDYELIIKEEELLLKADPIQFTQIIFNLAMNAIHFSPKNGKVTIKAFQNQNHIHLSISDQGAGISQGTLKKIFQPFFTTKSIGEGSGLGLSVVHGIVTSHKGSITATNNKNQGATFTIKLPQS